MSTTRIPKEFSTEDTKSNSQRRACAVFRYWYAAPQPWRIAAGPLNRTSDPTRPCEILGVADWGTSGATTIVPLIEMYHLTSTRFALPNGGSPKSLSIYTHGRYNFPSVPAAELLSSFHRIRIKRRRLLIATSVCVFITSGCTECTEAAHCMHCTNLSRKTPGENTGDAIRSVCRAIINACVALAGRNSELFPRSVRSTPAFSLSVLDPQNYNR